MDLIDRYLAAIARRLPADKADDIVAEIRDDLLTRQEAREDTLGRPLDKSEVSALIKDVGAVAIEGGRWELYVGGAGGSHVRKGDLLCTVGTEAEAMTRNSFGLNWRASRRISRRMS